MRDDGLRGGDFLGIAGLSSDDFLLVGVNSARVSFKNAALSNIGSMSPARLSLGTVASPHCRLLFHLAKGILAEHQRGLSGQFRTKRLSSLTGAGSQATVLRFRSGEKYFLDIPLYRSGCYANWDWTPVVSATIMFCQCGCVFSTTGDSLESPSHPCDLFGCCNSHTLSINVCGERPAGEGEAITKSSRTDAGCH